MRGVAIRAGIAAAVVIALFALAVAALNATLYSASGFVETYLDALGERDTATALEIAGGVPATSRRADLLVDAAIAPVTVTGIEEGEEVDGLVTVTVEFEAAGRSGTTHFTVQRSAPMFGIFATWTFAQSPLSTVEITVMHTTEFSVNGLEMRAPAQDQPVRYLAFAPSVLVLNHDSDLLDATPKTILVEEPNAPVITDISTQASATFVGVVQDQVDAYLLECAQQQVLMPSGCPFGQEIADRIVSAPEWSIAQMPEASLVPTSTPGEWTIPLTAGVAHLTVEVRSIFDGEVELFDEDVPFAIGFTVTFVGENAVVLTPSLG